MLDSGTKLCHGQPDPVWHSGAPAARINSSITGAATRLQHLQHLAYGALLRVARSWTSRPADDGLHGHCAEKLDFLRISSAEPDLEWARSWTSRPAEDGLHGHWAEKLDFSAILSRFHPLACTTMVTCLRATYIPAHHQCSVPWLTYDTNKECGTAVMPRKNIWHPVQPPTSI